MITKTYKAYAGQSINDAASQMVDLAKSENCLVISKFNDVEIDCAPESSPSDIVKYYHEECERRRAIYEASPAGIESKLRQQEYRRQSDAAAAEGILPFEIADPEGWAVMIDKNTDPYGACTMRYAARWANYMEREMATGKTISKMADATSSEADKEGITGFMYGCAVSILAHHWKHGEALRLWHNLKTQIGTEGEKANESGGVLNPALLKIGV